MKTKVAYVVVSSPNDIYLEQAYVSMFSLKHHMPDAYIVLLTDRLTSESLKVHDPRCGNETQRTDAFAAMPQT